MSKQYVVVRGDTKSFTAILKIDDTQVTDLTNWSCHIQLRNKDTKVLSGINREVTTKNQAGDAFVITLTSSETNIQPEEYILGIEYRNSQTSQVIEKTGDDIPEIKIVAGWVYSD